MPKILIIDDEEAAVFGYSRFFSKRGYSVQSAGTIEEGRSKMSCSCFDAVVLDLKLPDGNALEFIPEIRAVNENATIVVVSGMADRETQKAALNRGAHKFLVKPLQMETLCSLLKRTIEKSSQTI